MSIVKMKRLRVIGFAEERDGLLQGLLHMGCVEISEPEDKMSDPEWTALLRRDTSALTDRKAEAAALEGALEALDKYAPAKKGLFTRRRAISEAEFFQEAAKSAALRCAQEINACTREISRIYAAENKLNANLASLQPWAGLDLPLEQEGTSHTRFLLGTAPATADPQALREVLRAETGLAELFDISASRDQYCFLLVAHASQADAAVAALRPHSFSVVHFKGLSGTPQANIDRIRGEIQALEEQRQQQADRIAALGPQRAALQVVLDRVRQEINREAVAERFLTDGRIFFAEGWIPAEQVDAFAKLLSGFTCAWEADEPAREETPPTLLKNPKWMDCINMVTEMYSLPAYDGIDPNPLMFFWYVFFFGFMFADVAYGIIIFCGCLAIIKLFNPKNTIGRMMHLGLWLGGSAAICGIFVGGFFGNLLEVIYDTFLPGAVMPGWLQTFCSGLIVNPVNDPMKVLIIALAIGCVQLVFGQCVHIYMGYRDGRLAGLGDALLDVVPWWVFFAGIVALVVAGTPVGLLIGVLALVFTQGRHAKGIVFKFLGGLKSLYDTTSWLSDILSYARLMALMLAGSVIAQVFNTLAALPRNIIVFVLVFLIGHTFNIGVNLVGTYVHAARLQYLEFFGKFYKEGGIPFRPLKYDTKYVDIENKEEHEL